MTAAQATQETPVLQFGFAFKDGGKETYADWVDLCDSLTEIMKKINPKGQWHCNVQNFGWMARNGYKNLQATTGEKLLSGILPNTDCHFKVFIRGKGFGRYIAIQNFHHDSPSGNEWYEVVRFNGRKHPAT